MIMDNLTKQAVLARRAGVSYGKWMAMNAPAEIEKKIPEGWPICKYCKKPFKPRSKRQRVFCDVVCQQQEYYETHREEKLAYMRKHKNGRSQNDGGEVKK